MAETRQQQSRLLKPQGALGRLENLSVQLIGMTERRDWLPTQRSVIVFAADHGVAAQGISTVPPSITAYMVEQFLMGKAAINVLAKQMNTRLTVVDVGVNTDTQFSSSESVTFLARKIAQGTVDFTHAPAMTQAQAAQSLEIGAAVVSDEIGKGLDVLVLGEMGIGNTTSASAIIAALTYADAETVTGRGTGIDDETYQRKLDVIRAAIATHAPTDVDVLVKLGGFEIGAMAGAMLGAASHRIPIILDGLICTAAALVAHQYNPRVKDYLIAGHQSAEQGHRIALTHLSLTPLLSLEMRLGEGTGAVLALPIIEAAMRTLQEMGELDVG